MDHVDVVLDDLLNNIISYAYEGDEEHEINISMDLIGGRLAFTIEDDGKPFNPFQLEAPDTNLAIEERDIGGLGVHLIRNVMDEVSYHRRIDRNVVAVVKRFEATMEP